MPETLTDAQGGRCYYAPFNEAATPSSYVWEMTLPDAYFPVAAFGVKSSWSATDVYLKLELNSTVLVGSPDPPGANNWTVNGQLFYASEGSIGADLLNGVAAAGDTLRFTLRSPGSTAATGQGYFLLHVVPFSPLDVTVTPL